MTRASHFTSSSELDGTGSTDLQSSLLSTRAPHHKSGQPKMLGEKTAANALLLQELTDGTGVECARIHASTHMHMRMVSTLLGKGDRA